MFGFAFSDTEMEVISKRVQVADGIMLNSLVKDNEIQKKINRNS